MFSKAVANPEAFGGADRTTTSTLVQKLRFCFRLTCCGCVERGVRLEECGATTEEKRLVFQISEPWWCALLSVFALFGASGACGITIFLSVTSALVLLKTKPEGVSPEIQKFGLIRYPR